MRHATGDRTATRLRSTLIRSATIWSRVSIRDPHVPLNTPVMEREIRMECGGDRYVPVGHQQTAGRIITSPARRGRYASAHACKSASGWPADAHSYPLTNLEAIPTTRQASQNSTARSRQLPSSSFNVWPEGHAGPSARVTCRKVLEDLLVQRREKRCEVPFGIRRDRPSQTALRIVDMERVSCSTKRRGQRIRVRQRKVFRFGGEVEVERVGPQKFHTEAAGYLSSSTGEPNHACIARLPS